MMVKRHDWLPDAACTKMASLYTNRLLPDLIINNDLDEAKKGLAD
jgi:hypothetical protein